MTRPPLTLAVPGALAVGLLTVPLLGVLAGAPWTDLAARLASPPVRQALAVSLLVSGWALLLSLLLGVPLAWLLARTDFPGRAMVRSLVMLPMVLPPTVAGVALLQGFGRQGVVPTGLPFTTAGAVLAAAFVSLPFLVISLEGTLDGLHRRHEEAAASLGAGPLYAFRTVTLPMAMPGLLAGSALCWARALGEFGATITFAGNLPGTTQTLPLEVYLLLQDDPDGATAVSLLLLGIATAVLLALRGRRLTGERPGRSAGYPDRPEEPPGTAPAGRTTGSGTDHRPQSATGGRPAALAADVTGATTAVLNVPAGETVAVVGPNGAGKTTLLRALLGLTPRAAAEVLRIGGEELSRTPPHRRGIAWVPQDGALFPHLSALANTAYALRARGMSRGEARTAALGWLDRLGVADLAHRRVSQLSGGQAQHIALARALASRPRLLLLDEPLAALDQTARTRVRHTLRCHLADFPGVCLLVTHDPVEAATLADRILVLENGRAVQCAAPAELARRPRSPWVARMLGSNAWPAVCRAGRLEIAPGLALRTAGPLPSEGASALAVVPPEAVALHTAPPTGSTDGPRTVLPGRIREITPLGGRLRVLVDTDPGTGAGPGILAEVTAAAAAELGLAEGGRAWAVIEATELTAVPL